MKAILKFDFDDTDSDDKLRHEQAIRASDLCSIIFDFDNYLRNLLKHGNLTDDAYKIMEAARVEWNRMIDEYEVRHLVE